MSNRRKIAQALADAGLESHAIAGILANLDAESGFDPTNPNPTSGANGIAQWLGGRQTALKNYAAKKGKSWTNLGVQVDFLISEIKAGNQKAPDGEYVTIKSLNAQPNAAQAGSFFAHNFERGGHESERAAAASNYKKVARSVAGKGGKGNSGKTFTWVPGATDQGYNPFGKPNGRYEAGYHTGDDISAPDGSPIIWAPPVTGKVISRNASGGDYGKHMIVRDEKGREWLFAHMSSDPPKVGTVFEQGDKIGKVGNTGTSTGAHLHIEQTRQGPGGWDYGSSSLKAPKLEFVASDDYDGGRDVMTDKGRTAKGYYGYLYTSADYLDQPENAEIKAIVDKAKKQDWPEAKLQAEIRRSDWAKQRSENQRAFDTATPAEQMSLFRQAKASVRKQAAQMGVVLSKEDLKFEAMRIARDGDSADMQQFWLGSQYEYDPEDAQQGAAGDFQEELQSKAREYGFKYSDDDLEEWTQMALQNGIGADFFEDDMRQAAQAKFPTLNLDGRTLKQAITPWLASAAEELGQSYDEFDLTDPRWTAMVDQGGKMLDDQSWRTKIRTDDSYKWEGTERARQEYQQAAGSLMRLFGGYRFGG
jgi:murein DD-endopeptidase MepM/ murein hydrolase activator NlpD